MAVSGVAGPWICLTTGPQTARVHPEEKRVNKHHASMIPALLPFVCTLAHT
jgi:hypothetical protein